VFLRFLSPVVLFCVAGFVWHYNGTHTGSKVVVPFLDMVPALKGNIAAQVDASWKILAGLGVATLLYSIVDQLRRPRRRSPDDATEPGASTEDGPA